MEKKSLTGILAVKEKAPGGHLSTNEFEKLFYLIQKNVLTNYFTMVPLVLETIFTQQKK